MTVMAGALAACNNGATSTPPGGSSPSSNTYVANGTIAVTGVPPTAGAFSFDISFVDPTAGQYYLADRTTSGVDVINTSTLQYVLTAGKGSFTGNGTPGPGGAPATNGGPNGIVPVGGGIVFAGDGNSTLKVVNVSTGALVATVPTINPYTGAPLPATCGGTGKPTTGTANQRVDEMAFDPTDNVVMVVNDASCPPFATFFNSNPPYNILGTLAFTTANAGAEQPTWDPSQKQFIMALPSTIANPGGEVDLVDPHSFKVTKQFAIANCAPAGTALGQNEMLFLGCGNATGGLETINATTGALVNTIPNTGGADEVWYNPTANRFYGASANNAGGPIVVVADGNGNLIQTFTTSAGAHSIAVDASDRVYVPQRALGVTTYGHH